MKALLMVFAVAMFGAGVSCAQDVCAPAKVTTVHNDLMGYYSFTVEWVATGDDCATGNATSYEVRRSTSNITDTNWQSATVHASGSSATNGNEDCVSMTTSCPATTYYFAVFLIDDAGNRSPLSNVISVSARCSAPFQDVECY